MEFNESTANEIRSIIKMFINFNAAIKTVGHFQKEIVENLNNFTCCKTLRLMQFCHFFSSTKNFSNDQAAREWLQRGVTTNVTHQRSIKLNDHSLNWPLKVYDTVIVTL